MKKRVRLPIVGVLFGSALVSPWIFAAGQQTLQALSSPTISNSAVLQPPKFAQAPVIEAKLPFPEGGLSPQDHISFQRIVDNARKRDLYQRPIGTVMQAIAGCIPVLQVLIGELSIEVGAPLQQNLRNITSFPLCA